VIERKPAAPPTHPIPLSAELQEWLDEFRTRGLDAEKIHYALSFAVSSKWFTEQSSIGMKGLREKDARFRRTRDGLLLRIDELMGFLTEFEAWYRIEPCWTPHPAIDELRKATEHYVEALKAFPDVFVGWRRGRRKGGEIRRKPGNPYREIIGEARCWLANVGVTERDEQDELLRLIEVLPPPR
jgi:hypothetical protein